MGAKSTASRSRPEEGSSSPYAKSVTSIVATSRKVELVTNEELDRWKSIIFESSSHWEDFHPDGRKGKPQLEKCLAGFCHKHVQDQKTKWAQNGAREYERDFPLAAGAKEEVKKEYAEKKREFIETSSSLRSAPYKSQIFEPSLKDPNSQIMKEYRDFVRCMYDAKRMKEAYWTLGDYPSLDNLRGNTLPEFMRLFRNYYIQIGKSDEETVAELINIHNTLANKKGLAIRVIFVTIGNNDTKEKRETLAWSNRMAKAGAIIGVGAKYGMNHLGLQIGPYYIHWNDGHLVGIQKMSSRAAFAMFYPNEAVTLKLGDEEKINKLCDLIVSYNKTSYCNVTRNCQHFVDQALNVLECRKTWLPGGPIEKFLNHASNLEVGVHTLQCWSLNSETPFTFEDYPQFRQSCREDLYLVELLRKPVYKEEEKELVDVLKAIERAYIVSSGVPVEDKDLIFPVEGFMITAIG